jgi:hypothetical protein
LTKSLKIFFFYFFLNSIQFQLLINWILNQSVKLVSKLCLQHCPKRVNPAPSDMRILVGGFSRSNIFRCWTRPCQLQTTMKQIIQTLNVNTCPWFDIKPSYHHGPQEPASGQKTSSSFNFEFTMVKWKPGL